MIDSTPTKYNGKQWAKHTAEQCARAELSTAVHSLDDIKTAVSILSIY